MAISIDWSTKIITVPKADTQLLSAGPPEIRSLNIDAFRKALNVLQADEYGIAFETTHEHNPPLTVGGVTLARTVEIINGYTLTFENGAYAVNLEGANSNLGDVLNLNTVSVRTANSAGLTYSEAIEAQSFVDASVFIDTSVGVSGTDYPAGTPSLPSDNKDDAFLIAASRNLSKYELRGTITFGASDAASSTQWFGTDQLHSAINFTAGNATDHNAYHKVKLIGQNNAHGYAEHCLLDEFGPFWGLAEQCGIKGTLLVGGGLVLADCHSEEAGAARPVVDMQGLGGNLQIRGWFGGIKIINFTGGSASIDVSVGTVELDATCTAGTIVVRGVAELIDNSDAGCTVVTSGNITPLVQEMWAIAGLDASNPMTVTTASRSAGGINLDITGDGLTTSTVTRNDP